MAALVADPRGFEGREATIEGWIIREPDVREGRAAYIVRAQTLNGSPATGLVLVVDYRKDVPSFGQGDHRDAPPLEYGDRIIARGAGGKVRGAFLNPSSVQMVTVA